jgi:hypothetical protein
VGEPADGLDVQVQAAGDGGDRLAVFPQVLDCRVALGGPDHDLVLRWRWWRQRGWIGRWCGGGRLRGGFLQAATVAKHGLLDVFGEVVPQMPAIGDLDGVGCTLTGAVGVGAGAVPADHLGAWVLAEPAGERGCFSVLQQVDGPVGGHVHQDGAVLAAAAEREVVDTKHRDLVDLGVWECTQQAEQRRAGCRQPQSTRQPRSSPAGQR